MKLQHAIDVLAGGRASSFLYEREFAAARFAAWLNSTEDDKEQLSYVFVAFNQAVKKLRQEGSDIPQIWFDTVYDYDSYLKPTTVLSTDVVLFEEGEDHSFFSSRYIADVARFLLTYNPKDTDKRKQASLGKAWKFINQKGGFRNLPKNDETNYHYFRSLARHQSLLSKQKQTLGFQCARYYGSKFSWHVDPKQDSYFSRLIEIVAGAQKLAIYFGEVDDLQHRIRERIDKRSMADKDFIILPVEVVRSTCRLPALSGHAYGRMADYRRSVFQQPDDRCDR